MSDEREVRITAFVRGSIQGVGFRWWVRARALELGLRGSARNMPDGRVEVVMQGPADDCARLVALLDAGQPPASRPGRVEGLVSLELPLLALPEGFRER